MLIPLQIIGVTLAIIGCLLNVYKKKSCWVVWLAANAVFIWVYILAGLHIAIFLQCVYIVINIWGWQKWSFEKQQ